jgi:L-lysine exporter family protein LysE/ArgO
VAGFGALVTAAPWLAPAMRFGGAAFLLAYASRSLWSAWRNPGVLNPSTDVQKSLSATLLTCLAFTWLNPHVYLDTVVLLGSVSTRYAGQRLAFALGAITSSFLFFFALGYGARLLRPLFANPKAWRVLDAMIGITMALLAAKLVFQG